MQSETIHLNFTDSSKPFVLTGEADDGFVGLIMPMRV
jgi:DNA polymerase III sliding clamp (beta) subunit (PCNA family)